MSHAIDELRERLARLAPEFSDADWTDVERRASAKMQGRRRRIAPRILIAAAVVLLMGGSLALAVGGRVLAVFDHSSAPPPVERAFQQLVKPLRPGAAHDSIVPGSEHRVLTIRTLSGGSAAVWVARTRKGLECFVSVGKPFGPSGCRPTTGGLPLKALQWSSLRHDKQHIGRGLTLVGQLAANYPGLIRVFYANGGHLDVRPVGGWFMVEIPSAHTLRRTAPARVILLKPNGATQILAVDPLRLRASRPLVLVTDVKLLAQATLPNHGGIVRISTGRWFGGKTCFRWEEPAQSAVRHSPPWDCSAGVGRYGLNPTSTSHVPVRWQTVSMTRWKRPVGVGYVYAFGWVAPRVTRLTIRFQDGGSTDVTLHDRYFLYVVPEAHWRLGRRPETLEARDGAGTVVYHQALDPGAHCVYPGRDSACRGIDVG